jgi:hypothetical protein
VLSVVLLNASLLACQTSVSKAVQPTFAAPVVRLEPSPAHVYQGQTMTLRAMIYNVTDLAGFDLRIAWDTTYLDCESHNATLGCLIPPILITKDEVNETAGTYWLAVGTLSLTGFTGSGEAFEMTFRLLNPGTTTVNFTSHEMASTVNLIWNVAVDASMFITLGGDVDGNRQVDIFDIVLMAGGYGTSEGQPKFNANCDIDGDGDIDIFDIVKAAVNYGKSW